MHKSSSAIFLLFALNMSAALAFDYDPLLMRAQASIFPKIILLDQDLASKVSKDEVVVTVVCTGKDKSVAARVKELIENQYQSNLGERKLSVKIVEYAEFDSTEVSTAYFMLKGKEVDRSKVTSHAAKMKRLAFSYDYKDFSSNALVSVLMKEKTYIYLNKSAIHDYDIKFLPLFYKIVKIIE